MFHQPSSPIVKMGLDPVQVQHGIFLRARNVAPERSCAKEEKCKGDRALGGSVDRNCRVEGRQPVCITNYSSLCVERRLFDDRIGIGESPVACTISSSTENMNW